MESSGPSSASTSWEALGWELPPLDHGFLPPNIGQLSKWHSQLGLSLNGHWLPVASPGFPSVADIREPTGDCSSCLLTSNLVDPSNGHGTEPPEIIPWTPKVWVMNEPILWFSAVGRGQISTKFTFCFFLRCVACGILVHKSGIKPRLPAVKAQNLNHWTREVLSSLPSSLVEPPTCQMQGFVIRVWSVHWLGEMNVQWCFNIIWWVAARRSQLGSQPWSAKVHPVRSVVGQDPEPVQF